ncbi:hypothetical protein FPZ12_000040 [Amycolatopsis acidicola]|uniref:Uncharacterized protein n=1 Tax=Amycolatopsis acidicola TaxID=2596893 RepID=A0A5N0VKD4_9PSEU|nr:hypothetical protein [Amycolatopsis acidicola]KAA9166655.1 hypothetical protein FPZ12_000040 [Amycolatopsis acidicola]
MPTRSDLTRKTRKVVIASALAAMFTGGLFTGSASASTVLSQGCTGTVVGNMGDTVAVQGKDVAGLVKAGAQEQNVFLGGVDPDKLANEITAKGALTVGSIPNAANGTVTGENVAAAVNDALKGADGLGWWGPDQQQKTLDSIKNKVTGSCGLTTYASNFTTTTGLPSAGTGGTAPATVPNTGSAGSVAGTGSATAPPRDYGNIPAAVPGIALSPGDRYPSSAPMSGAATPEIGVLPGNSAGQTDVRNAGNANALADDSSAQTVQLPMLLAVVALAGVSAALVRTWVLRKVS